MGNLRKQGELEAKGTYLLLRDVELVPFQHHIAVFPNLPENPFPAEFPDPADLLGQRRLMIPILRPLPRGQEQNRQLGDHSFFLLSTRRLATLLSGDRPPEAGVPEPEVRSPLPRGSHSEGLSPVALSSPFSQINNGGCGGNGPEPRWPSDRHLVPPPPPTCPRSAGLTAFSFISHCLLAAAERAAHGSGSPGDAGWGSGGNYAK